MKLKFKIRQIHKYVSTQDHKHVAITNKQGGDIYLDRKASALNFLASGNNDFIIYEYKKL